MPDAVPYAYARACGIIGKSLIGKRIPQLAVLRSLSDLERLVFKESRSEFPGKELLTDLEKRIIARTINQILLVICSFEKPPELLVQMLRVYEYSDLRTALQNIIYGEKTPTLCDIGRFGTVNFKAYPDAAVMLKDTEFAFILSDELKAIKSGSANIASIEAKLDSLYYNRLIKYISYLGEEDRRIIQRILFQEISLRN
jgi:vacuolar-type H+-ATPase subunit C/Vma6